MLLTLARVRLEDKRGEQRGSVGWIAQEDYCVKLRTTPDRLNVDVFRARKQFASPGSFLPLASSSVAPIPGSSGSAPVPYSWKSSRPSNVYDLLSIVPCVSPRFTVHRHTTLRFYFLEDAPAGETRSRSRSSGHDDGDHARTDLRSDRGRALPLVADGLACTTHRALIAPANVFSVAFAGGWGAARLRAHQECPSLRATGSSPARHVGRPVLRRPRRAEPSCESLTTLSLNAERRSQRFHLGPFAPFDAAERKPSQASRCPSCGNRPSSPSQRLRNSWVSPTFVALEIGCHVQWSLEVVLLPRNFGDGEHVTSANVRRRSATVAFVDRPFPEGRRPPATGGGFQRACADLLGWLRLDRSGSFQ